MPNYCGAKSRQKGTPCRLPAGWGTSHPGTGRCKLHGGCSTGPRDPSKLRGNKNALKTGEYETIFYDTLDEEEREIYASLIPEVANQLDEEIRLITIRERRMLKRIQALKEQEARQEEVLEEVINSEKEGTTKRHVAPSVRIQQIEEALTRVQREKAKLLELKHKVLNTPAEDEDALAGLVEAIKQSAIASKVVTKKENAGESE